jgi:hypothetical protein
MDDSQFDDLARLLSPSRRSVLAALSTALLATLFRRYGAVETLAKRKKRRSRQADKPTKRDSGRVRADRKKKKKKKRRGGVIAPPASPPASPPPTSPPPVPPSPLPGCGNCDDGITCTIDTCDTPTGTCLHTPDDSRCGPHWVCDIQRGCICPAPRTACGPDCVDTQNDRTHCGTCANVCPIQAPQTCGMTGQCVQGICQRYGPEDECGAARCVDDEHIEVSVCLVGGCQSIILDCPGGCDPATASCRRPCSQDSECGSDRWCNGGRCQFTQGNGTACSAATPQQCISGFCVDGVCCDSACDAPPHTTRSCTTGNCVVSCSPGFANCDGNMNNGCEADLTSDQHCGQCGNDCATRTCGPGLHGECRLDVVSNTYRCECVG